MELILETPKTSKQIEVVNGKWQFKGMEFKLLDPGQRNALDWFIKSHENGQ